MNPNAGKLALAAAAAGAVGVGLFQFWKHQKEVKKPPPPPTFFEKIGLSKEKDEANNKNGKIGHDSNKNNDDKKTDVQKTSKDNSKFEFERDFKRIAKRHGVKQVAWNSHVVASGRRPTDSILSKINLDEIRPRKGPTNP